MINALVLIRIPIIDEASSRLIRTLHFSKRRAMVCLPRVEDDFIIMQDSGMEILRRGESVIQGRQFIVRSIAHIEASQANMLQEYVPDCFIVISPPLVITQDADNNPIEAEIGCPCKQEGSVIRELTAADYQAVDPDLVAEYTLHNEQIFGTDADDTE